MYDIVILAGGGCQPDLCHEGEESKGFIKLGGRMMIEYVIETARMINDAGSVVLSGPENIPDEIRKKVDKICCSGKGIIDSLSQGLRECTTEKVIVMPCDTPFITKEASEDFIESCRKRSASFYYSYLPKEISEHKYPALPHTYARLKEGTFCGGSLVMIDREDFHKGEKLLRMLTGSRKNLAGIAFKLGPIPLFKFLTHTITVPELEKVGEKILGLKVAGIKSEYAEIAFNVDEYAHFEIAEKYIKN